MRRLGLLLSGLSLLLAGCAGEDTRSTTLTVLAAATLTDAFQQVGAAFEAGHPGVDVAFDFAGSNTLARRILDGAPGDVFASADEARMEQVGGAGLLAAPPSVFATNRLTLVVEPGNPEGITGVADLARDDLVVVLAAEEVPAGAATRLLLARAGVEVRPDSLEPDVRAVISKVALGEADTGVVYATDAAAMADRVDEVRVPDELTVTVEHVVAPLVGSAEPDLSAGFVRFLLGDGAQILSAAGFGT